MSQVSTSIENALACYQQQNFPQAELICHYLIRKGQDIAQAHALLGDICLSLEADQYAIKHFTKALELEPKNDIVLKKLAVAKIAKERHRQLDSMCQEGNQAKFVLIKAWGAGFWADVEHVLGQLLVAELTGRIPIVHWGDNSLYWDKGVENAFELYFEPTSPYTIEDLLGHSYSFYPTQWTEEKLRLAYVPPSTVTDARVPGFYFLSRNETVVVSNFFTYVHDLVPWIDENHPLFGKDTQTLYYHLFEKYLKIRPDIRDEIEQFWSEQLAGHKTLAVHIRCSDKIQETSDLYQINQRYPQAINNYLEDVPDSLIFLLTDDAFVLNEYQRIYGERLRYTDCTRTNSEVAIYHLDLPSRQKIGREILKDTYLAAKCDYFIGNGRSTVSTSILHLKEWRDEQYLLLADNWRFVSNFLLHNW